jgi:H+/Cl- antiporter ClcA
VGLNLFFFKIPGTALNPGSGNSGGIFAPRLLMGAMPGGTAEKNVKIS